MEYTAVYDYHGADGKLLYQKCRHEKAGEKKLFTYRRSDGNGGYVYNLGGVKQTLYRLHELLSAPMQDFVAIAEGEKDADRLGNKTGVKAEKSDEAIAWLEKTIPPSESMPSKTVYELADNAGIRKSTLDRARKDPRCNIVAKYGKEFWVWENRQQQ